MVRPTPSYLVQREVGQVDSALEHEVFDEAADGVVGERGDDGCLEAEAAAESAGYVVLAAAFGGDELACGGDAVVAGIEAEHDFAEGDEVPLAFGGGAEGEGVICGHGAAPDLCVRVQGYLSG